MILLKCIRVRSYMYRHSVQKTRFQRVERKKKTHLLVKNEKNLLSSIAAVVFAGVIQLTDLKIFQDDEMRIQYSTNSTYVCHPRGNWFRAQVTRPHPGFRPQPFQKTNRKPLHFFWKKIKQEKIKIKKSVTNARILIDETYPTLQCWNDRKTEWRIFMQWEDW